MTEAVYSEYTISQPLCVLYTLSSCLVHDQPKGITPKMWRA